MTYTYTWKNTSKRAQLCGRECEAIAFFVKMRSAWVRFENGQEECVRRAH